MNNAIKSRTLKLVITAVMTALTCVVTVYVNIPNGVGGNINIGDSLIFISASLLGALRAACIGGIGSMIADFVGGYAAFAPFTLIVKGLEGLVAGLVSYYAFNLESKNRLSGIARILLTIGGMIAAALVMTLGYFVTSLILNNGMIKTALTESVGNLIQGAISVVVASVAVFVARLDTVAKRYLYVCKYPQDKSEDKDNEGREDDIDRDI